MATDGWFGLVWFGLVSSDQSGMDVFLNSGIVSVLENLSDRFQDLKRTYNMMGTRASRHRTKSEREEKIRNYEEYYLKNHSRRQNVEPAVGIIVSRKNLTKRSMSTVSENNNKALSDLRTFRMRCTSSISRQSTCSQTKDWLSYNSNHDPQNCGQILKSSSHGQIYLTRTTPPTSSYTNSGLDEVFSEEDDVFFDFNVATKDSISDHELDDNEIQITIFHEHKRNLLTVSIHRATPVLEDSEKLFAKVSIQPAQKQTQKGQRIDLQKVKRWEEDFVFKKLTIGQLESCSVIIKIYQKTGIFKSATEQYVAKVALKDVDIKGFETTKLMLQKPTSY
ncbi:hypothetical protein LOTGIDRAFT_153592 [Lottia gigantea]|uniref:C2 domain-containing protein n=1 Tax=Lottia gigantea TaxID=225164 RepID=V4ACV7_LOTGI|nr:hypothetical protein LOTGIDRAFT_153592 [Lottia gigantea]ESO91161.1 hypothetical protein LOTGIDRAFT_153592 [Lottia gigantea]